MTPMLTSISLSSGGSVLEENFYPGETCLSQAVAVPGGASIWCGASSTGITGGPLSPDGTLVATTAFQSDLQEWNAGECSSRHARRLA